MSPDKKAFDRSLSIYALSSRSHRRPPEDLFAELSQHHPVRWDPFASVWLVSRRAEARIVLTDSRFSAARFSRSVDVTEEAVIARVHDAIARQALFLDGAEHLRWQSILRKTLTAGSISGLSEWISQRTGQLLKEHGTGDVDMLKMLARPLPLEVIVKLLNLPVTQCAMLLDWSDAYTTIVTGFEPTVDAATYQLVNGFLDYCLALVSEREAAMQLGDTKQSDGAARFIRVARAAGVEDNLDLASNLMMLISAGHQTTTGFLATVIAKHAAGPLGSDDLERLLVAVSPSRFVGRTVTADVELAGQQLRTGQSVLVLLAAANWNDDAADAHLVFGHGKHFCPGAALARLESEIVLGALFDGSRHLEHAEPATTWNRNVNLPCPVSVPVRLTTASYENERPLGT